MRKQTKIAAMVSAAALLTIGAAMTSFAAGWTMDGEDWVYLDKYGERVTNEWKKSGNNWYYMGDDGLMVTNTLIRDAGSTGTDIYYVNSGGIKVTNCWIELPNDDDFVINDQEPSNVYYYMGADGKATRATDNEYVIKQVKKNNNTTEKAYFVFDEQGHMMTGWVDVTTTKEEGPFVYDSRYRLYLGDEEEGDEAGVARTGWQYLEDPADVENYDPYETEHWYWFNETGKLIAPNTTRYIDGKYYHFGDGRYMDNGWFDFDPASGSDIGTSPEAKVGRTRSDGRMVTGWVQRAEDEEDEVYWYYLINERGENNRVVATVPFNRNGAGRDNYTGSKAEYPNEPYAARSIGNKIYLFNSKGQMVSGLVNTDELADWTGADVYNSNGRLVSEMGGTTKSAVVKLDENETYYFKNTAGGEGQMIRNSRAEVVIDGETYYYYFDKDGHALKNTIKSGVLYGSNGVRVNSDAGWMAYTLSNPVTYVANSKTYEIEGDIAVNASGHVRTLTIPTTTKATTSSIRIDGESYTVTWTLISDYVDADHPGRIESKIK